MKCGQYKFCVGIQRVTGGNFAPVCYGQANGCKWGSNDCSTDQDCVTKYGDGGTSPYYFNPDPMRMNWVCPYPSYLWDLDHKSGKDGADWASDVCTCAGGQTPDGTGFTNAVQSKTPLLYDSSLPWCQAAKFQSCQAWSKDAGLRMEGAALEKSCTTQWAKDECAGTCCAAGHPPGKATGATLTCQHPA
jgi:hypothetical protein